MVGLDPGTTTGIAVLDINVNLLSVYSQRNITRAGIINHILQHGSPVLISSDVSETPRSIEKIATKLGCKPYSPETALTLAEKKELARDYLHLVKNSHELDALSASIKALNSHQHIISKVSENLKAINREDIFHSIVPKVIKEHPANIEDVVKEFIENESAYTIVPKSAEDKGRVRPEVFSRLERNVSEKQKSIDSLTRQNFLLNKALNETRKEIGELKRTRFKHEKPRDENYKSLEYVKNLRRIENKGYYPVIGIDRVDLEAVEKLNELLDLENRVVLVKNADNIQILNDFNIKCAITTSSYKEGLARQIEFPLITVEEDLIEHFDNIRVIRIDHIEKLVASAKKAGLLTWLKGYKKRRI